MKPLSRSNSKRAFTRVDVIAAVAIMAVLAGVLLPAFARQGVNDSPERAKLIQCMNNLKQVGLAFRLWSNDHGDNYPGNVPKTRGGTKEYTTEAFRHFQVLSNELTTPKILVCPVDNERPVATNFKTFGNENLSYFVALDGDERFPAMPQAGDRNLSVDGKQLATGLASVATNEPSLSWTEALHGNKGMLLLADGSVQQTSTPGLKQFFLHSYSPQPKIRLAIP